MIIYFVAYVMYVKRYPIILPVLPAEYRSNIYVHFSELVVRLPFLHYLHIVGSFVLHLNSPNSCLDFVYSIVTFAAQDLCKWAPVLPLVWI